MLQVNDDKIKWFDEARFGVFIHWGLYSATEGCWNGKEVSGIGEWIAAKEKIPTGDYEKLASKMTCKNFNAVEWAKLVKEAGMKYCVFTAKHHDGFAMFKTEYDDYSVAERTPYGRDVALELADAMREEGLHMCFYYSHALDFHDENAMGNTWENPVPENQRDFLSYINGKCKYQLKELLTNYGDIGVIWMDVPKGITEDIAIDLKSYVQKYQPNCLVNGRIGGTSDMGDYGCLGDNQIPAGKLEGCWETASTMNDTWGYKKNDKNFKTPKEIIELLCGLLSKGTNLLLNIGPKPDGEIPEESIYLLKELAKWYKVNGEAVSGTHASPFGCDFSFGAASQKGNNIYLYVYEQNDKIEIYGIENEIKSIAVLGHKEIGYKHDEKLCIDLSDIRHDGYAMVIKIELDGVPKIKNGTYQQESNFILPASVCEIVYEHKDAECTTLEGDDSVTAENFNLIKQNTMSVTVAGVVENWFSEKNYIQWEFECSEAGEYEMYLYTLTHKYMKWVGGHRVRVECNGMTIHKTITSDKASKGANKKYFDETGSFIGILNLNKGKNFVKLFADEINIADGAGLSVSKVSFCNNIIRK